MKQEQQALTPELISPKKSATGIAPGVAMTVRNVTRVLCSGSLCRSVKKIQVFDIMLRFTTGQRKTDLDL